MLASEEPGEDNGERVLVEHEGKELSLDAVLWLKATDMVK